MAAVAEACDAETGLLWGEEPEDDESFGEEEGRHPRGQPATARCVAPAATVASLAAPRWSAAAAAAAEALLPERRPRPTRLLKAAATAGTVFLVLALLSAVFIAASGAAGRRSAAGPLSGPPAEPLEGVSMEVKALEPQGGPADLNFAEAGDYAAPVVSSTAATATAVADAADATTAQQPLAVQAGQSFAQTSADYGAFGASTPAPPNGVAGFSREAAVDAPTQAPAPLYQQAPAASGFTGQSADSEASILDQTTYSTAGTSTQEAGVVTGGTGEEQADLTATQDSSELSAPSLVPATHVEEGLGYESDLASQGATVSSTPWPSAENAVASAGEALAAAPAAEALSYSGGYSSTSVARPGYAAGAGSSYYSGWQSGEALLGGSSSTPQPYFIDVGAASTTTAPAIGDVFYEVTTVTRTTTRTMTRTITSTQTASLTTTSTTTTPLDVLFCFSVMMATGYEGPLMRAQLKKGVGIFACEKYSVFSSDEVELSPGPPVKVATENIGDLHCNFGGPYNLALNSEIFARAWKRVFRDGHYKHAAWTVKVDPDAVFLPSRLRRLVRGADETANVYLNNCDQGLHGPIEVIALGGMRVFDRNMSDCIDNLQHEWTWAGEDVFLRHCLGFVGVNRVDSFQLLDEDHCFHGDPAKQGCYSGKVSFHPFKSNDGYFKCLSQAEGAGEKDKHEGKREGSEREWRKGKA